MKLNPVIQKKIVSELRKGVSLRQVAKKVRVSPTTVTVISNKLKEINIKYIKRDLPLTINKYNPLKLHERCEYYEHIE